MAWKRIPTQDKVPVLLTVAENTTLTQPVAAGATYIGSTGATHQLMRITHIKTKTKTVTGFVVKPEIEVFPVEITIDENTILLIGSQA